MHRDRIEELYEDYADDVYRFLYSMCRDPQTAEDLTQVTFVRVINGIAAFRGDCTVKTWLFTIARREYFRWQKKNPDTVPLNESIVQEAREGELDRREQAQCVLRYLAALDEPRRTLMTLRLTAELSYREIAAILGKTEVWARVTFLRGKQKLLEDLKEELE